MIQKYFGIANSKKIFDVNFEYCDLLESYCQEVLFFRCVEICLGIRGLMVSKIMHLLPAPLAFRANFFFFFFFVSLSAFDSAGVVVAAGGFFFTGSCEV